MELNRKTLEELLTLFPQLADCNAVLRKYYGKKLADMTDADALPKLPEMINAAVMKKANGEGYKYETPLKDISTDIDELADLINNTAYASKFIHRLYTNMLKVDADADTLKVDADADTLSLIEDSMEDVKDIIITHLYFLDHLREHYADVLKETPLEEQEEKELTEDQLNGTCLNLNGINVQLDAIKILAANKNEAITERIRHVYKLHIEIKRMFNLIDDIIQA
jgi:hypothetical protein